MRKIDWYILKKFLFTFFFSLLLFTAIAIMIDASEKLDNLISSGFTVKQVITQYLVGFVPYIWALLFPLFAFIAVIFFTSKMAVRSEIIAILGSGTSFLRMLRPFFIGSIFLAALLWMGTNYWVPKAQGVRTDFQAKYVDNKDPTKNRNFTNCFGCFYLRTDSNSFAAIKQYDPIAKIAQGFFLQRVKDGKVIYNLRASTFRWDSTSQKWELLNAVERVVDSMSEVVTRYPTLKIELDLKPNDLKKDFYLKDRLTTPELSRLIRQQEMRGAEGLIDLKVERFRRTAIPASLIVMSMIGAIVASRKTRGGRGVHLALGIVIAASFILFDRFSTVFAVSGHFPAWLATWLANIIFSAVACWLYVRTPK